MSSLAQFIALLANVLTLLVFIYAVLTWTMPPYHPLRESLERIFEPMLAPIRRVIPPVGMFDISSMILMILIQLVARVLISIILAL